MGFLRMLTLPALLFSALMLEGTGGDPGGGGDPAGGGDPGGGGGGDPAPATDPKSDPAGTGPKRVEEMTEAEAKAELIATRGEAKGYRTDLKTEKEAREGLEKRLKAIEDGQKSDLEKAQETADEEKKERERLQGELDKERKVNAILREAGVEGQKSKDPDAVVRFIDLDKVVLEGDDSNVKELVQKVLKDKPYLAPESSSSSGNPGGGGRKDDDVKPGRGRIAKAYEDAKT